MDFCETAYGSVIARIGAAAAAARRGDVRLLAVSKGQPADAIRRLAGLGQRACHVLAHTNQKNRAEVSGAGIAGVQ